MKECSEFGAPGLYGRKFEKLLRKNMRKPHPLQKTERQKGDKQALGCGGARELRHGWLIVVAGFKDPQPRRSDGALSLLRLL
jgi:hypothetical protein